MFDIINEVKDLYKIIRFKEFRKTKGVSFDIIPISDLGHIDSADRVIHDSAAVSPGRVGEVERPWYMHPYQQDNLVVLHGTRHVDIYTPQHGAVERFKVTPEEIYHNDKLIVSGGAMLIWPRGVFHRIVSGEEGSVSINFAVHFDGFDINTNFNIYDVDTVSGEYRVIRKGSQDQF